MGQVSLERALSKLGIASRSQTKEWIETGRLKINGRVITNPKARIVPETSIFELDGKILQSTQPVLLMLHKPKGYVTTKSDEKGRKTVYDLLPPNLQHVHPIGRLDMHTSGLLLLTNDTQLSNFLTDPANAIERQYVLTCKGRLEEAEAKQMEKGIVDDREKLQAKSVTLRKVSNRESHALVTLTSGKNREIRRLFEHFEHEVTQLKRIAFGEYQLGELEIGKLKHLPVNISHSRSIF